VFRDFVEATKAAGKPAEKFPFNQLRHSDRLDESKAVRDTSGIAPFKEAAA